MMRSRLRLTGVLFVLIAGCGGSAAPCERLLDTSGLLNSGPADVAWAVKSSSSSPSGASVYAVALADGSSVYVLLHSSEGPPGSSGWDRGMWSAADSSSQSATGFPLNSNLSAPYETDSIAAVRSCVGG